MVFIIVLSTIGLFILFFIISFNSFVSKKNQVKNVKAGLNAVLKKRYDLIPNLISTVQQFMKHENDLLVKLSEIRTKAANSKLSEKQKVELDKITDGLMHQLMISVENYPELKSSNNFLQLQASLNEVEEEIAAGRRAYNGAVTDYNNKVEMFPSNIVAAMISYRKLKLLTLNDSEKKNVDVNQLFNSTQ